MTTRGIVAQTRVASLPTELEDVVDFLPHGVFIHEYMPSRISSEKHLMVKANEKNYIIADKGGGQLWAYELGDMPGRQNGVRVYFDDANNKIHFNRALPEGKGLDYEVLDGKYFINLYGKNCEFIYKPDVKLPYVVLERSNGETTLTPVYQDVISKVWHVAINGGHPVFDANHLERITRLSVPYSKNFYYHAKDNLNPTVFGDAKIYDVSNIADVTDYPLYQVIEMKGALMPVRVVSTSRHGVRYEVYDLNNQPKKGLWLNGMAYVECLKSRHLPLSPTTCGMLSAKKPMRLMSMSASSRIRINAV